MTSKKQVNTPPARPAGQRRSTARVAADPEASNQVHIWGAGKGDGATDMKPLFGSKGAKLAELARMGLPVPPGFTITTGVCAYYHANKRSYPALFEARVKTGILSMEKAMGCKFGDAKGDPGNKNITQAGLLQGFDKVIGSDKSAQCGRDVGGDQVAMG